jgi:hypothetical protein
VRTFTGDVLLSQQEYERSPLTSEKIILQDMSESYAEALQQQSTSGSGSNGQLLGLLNVSTSPTPGSDVPGSRAVYLHERIADTERTRSGDRTMCRADQRHAEAVTVGGFHARRSLVLARRLAGRLRERTGSAPGHRCCARRHRPRPVGADRITPHLARQHPPHQSGERGQPRQCRADQTKDVILLEDPLGPRFTAMPGTMVAGQLTVVVIWHT